jgi:hypothetical protein
MMEAGLTNLLAFPHIQAEISTKVLATVLALALLRK